MKRIRVHSVEQYVKEIGPLLQQGLEMYRADVPEEGLLGVGFSGADTEVLISIAEFKATGDLIKYGEVRRGTIGGIILVDKLTPQLAEDVGAPNTSGALVIRMARNSEAYNAGVRPGDVIVGFNGRPVEDPSQLFRMVADAPIGSTATIRVLRNRRPSDIKVPIVADSRGRRQ